MFLIYARSARFFLPGSDPAAVMPRIRIEWNGSAPVSAMEADLVRIVDRAARLELLETRSKKLRRGTGGRVTIHPLRPLSLHEYVMPTDIAQIMNQQFRAWWDSRAGRGGNSQSDSEAPP